MNIVEIEKTNSRTVSCGGLAAPYDHPKIYLEIEQETGNVTCPYCSKQFQYNGK